MNQICTRHAKEKYAGCLRGAVGTLEGCMRGVDAPAQHALKADEVQLLGVAVLEDVLRLLGDLLLLLHVGVLALPDAELPPHAAQPRATT
jgi:uncharacterized membrane protein